MTEPGLDAGWIVVCDSGKITSGEGFGVAQPDGACPHCADRTALFRQLEQHLALRAAK